MGPVLSVSKLEKTFELRRTVFSQTKKIIKAVDNVSFELHEGKTLGIVGESGSGKSTLARCLLLLERPDNGSIKFCDQDILRLSEQNLKNVRKEIQIIFQDPYSSLNPRKKVSDALKEPLLFHKIVEKQKIDEKLIEILRNIGLDEDVLHKYPHEMSGGQRQRVAIGRALASNPSLLIADEPVSSLDVSIQAQIINLFMNIKKRSRISMIFISHDLNVVQFMADDIIVLYKGRILEMGGKDAVFFHPLHPYTQMLMRAAQGELCAVREKVENNSHEGCAYYERCEMAERSCAIRTPNLLGTKEHSVACFKTANNMV